MLILSAIKTKDGNIYVGKRHNNIIKDNIDVNFKNGIQGFVDDKNNFYDRKEAYIYAIKVGQIKKEDDLISKILTSEDLW